MAALFGENNLAIFGYGSLLTDPEDCRPCHCAHPADNPSLTGAIDLRQAEKILLENGAGYKRGV